MTHHSDADESERGFAARLASYGGVRALVVSWDFLVALPASVVLAVLCARTGRLEFIAHSVCPQLAAIAAGFIGIVLAAVAVIGSFADRDFMRFLVKTRALGRLLAPYDCALWISVVALLANLVVWGAAPQESARSLGISAVAERLGFPALCWFGLFAFLYAVLAFAALIPATLDLAQERADFLAIADVPNGDDEG